MIAEPERHIEAFAEAGADSITFHEEATPHANRTLAAIRELGCLAGIAINPGTPVEALAELRGLADIVLCMTVNPGWGGQSFIEGSPDKVARLAEVVGEARIEVDGGIDADTAGSVADAGASLFVAGSAVFGADDPAAAYTEIAAAAGAEAGKQSGRRSDVLCTERPRTPNAPPQPRAIRAPMTSCHQARSAGSSPPRLGAPLAPARQRLAAADRDDALGDHRVAAVGEGDQGARPLAPAAQDGDHRDAADVLGRRGVVAVVAHRPHREDLRRAARRQPRRRRGRRSARRASAGSAPRPRRAARRGRARAARRPRAARSSRAAGSRRRRGRSR